MKHKTSIMYQLVPFDSMAIMNIKMHKIEYIGCGNTEKFNGIE